MNQLKLRAVSTFYQSKSYDTWLHPATKEGYQLGHFFIPTIHAKYIVNVKWKMNGVPGDHAAISLKIILPNFKFVPLNKRTSTKNEAKMINNKLLRELYVGNFKSSINDFIKQIEKEKTKSSLPILPHPTPEDLEQLERFITNKAKELAEEMTWQHPDWFTQDENILLKLIKDHNTAFKISLSNQTNESRDSL